ncbi:MAG: isocitrate/isopropylmalate family dehydrogenase, partial [Candidatus Kariarchaeaceae archaeon]
MTEENVKKTVAHFENLVREQLDRVERLKSEPDWTDFAKLEKIVIGARSGDGIGPAITEAAIIVLNYLLESEINAGKVEIRRINGLTIENRVKVMKAIPDDVLAELKECHTILKGPTTTPWKGNKYGWPNIESANVSMRRELDLFAN